MGALGVAGDFLIAFIVLVILVARGCLLPLVWDCFLDDDDPAAGGKGDSGDVGAGAVILCTPAL